ncbi:MAG: hypothetical protein HYU69_09005 [Bacteroidetes bacterium]|nr:hypothetical protein [Bacteroidota bacterium]
MVTVIKLNSTKQQIQRFLKKIKFRRGINAYKYCGVIKLKESPFDIQKRMRDEWE